MLKAIQRIQGEKMEKLNIQRLEMFSTTVMVGKLGCLLALVIYGRNLMSNAEEL